MTSSEPGDPQTHRDTERYENSTEAILFILAGLVGCIQRFLKQGGQSR